MVVPIQPSAACPIPVAEPCDPCEQPCPVCPEETGSACPCPVVPTCPAPPQPACGVCPNVSKNADFMERQVYAYPASVYPRDTAIPADPYAIGLSPDTGVSVARSGIITTPVAGLPIIPPATIGGVPVTTTGAAAGIPFYNGMPIITGGAANMPCYSDLSQLNAPRSGIDVSRNEIMMDGSNCPITVDSCTSTPVLKRSMLPAQVETGAAAPLTNPFEDVPSGFWASQDISKLAAANVIAGYPDRTFKPNLPVSRAEFASMIIAGLNQQGQQTYSNQIFRDVSSNHWANDDIDRAVAGGLMTGYPDNTFKPNVPVSRAEALATISKAINCAMDPCKAEEVLQSYCDGNQVPEWGKVSIAKALQTGILNDTPAPNQIMPASDATRADIASMLSGVRISIGIDPKQECAPTGAAAMIQQEEIISVPTLNVKFDDMITSNASHVGDKFVAKTVDPITINGVTFPAGSKVNGNIIEVIRPARGEDGALKVAFKEIHNGSMHSVLPRQILTAQVQKEDKQNLVSRAVQWPFVWTGRLLGDVGRTVGSMVIITGNGVEEVTNGVGVAAGEVFEGEFPGAGRSLWGSTKALFRTPVDVTRTALSGTAGLFNITIDEISYLVSPDGTRISRINPNEVVSVAFGCQ
jgi:hypothetical protein